MHLAFNIIMADSDVYSNHVIDYWFLSSGEWCSPDDHHLVKSIFACIQVTSRSTKAPLYSATSLVYKWKLICRGAWIPIIQRVNSPDGQFSNPGTTTLRSLDDRNWSTREDNSLDYLQWSSMDHRVVLYGWPTLNICKEHLSWPL
jgi:hypothetical protein